MYKLRENRDNILFNSQLLGPKYVFLWWIKLSGWENHLANYNRWWSRGNARDRNSSKFSQSKWRLQEGKEDCWWTHHAKCPENLREKKMYTIYIPYLITVITAYERNKLESFRHLKTKKSIIISFPNMIPFLFFYLKIDYRISLERYI